jgi:hypothetical protein
VRRGLRAARKLVMAGVIDSHLYNAYRTEGKLFGFVRGGRSARFHVRSA